MINSYYFYNLPLYPNQDFAIIQNKINPYNKFLRNNKHILAFTIEDIVILLYISNNTSDKKTAYIKTVDYIFTKTNLPF